MLAHFLLKMLTNVVKSILEPGTNPDLVRFVNIIFLALVLVTLVLAVILGANIHLIVLLVLSTCLLVAVNW